MSTPAPAPSAPAPAASAPAPSAPTSAAPTSAPTPDSPPAPEGGAAPAAPAEQKTDSGAAPLIEEKPAFDWTAWDGKLDVLPEDVREPAKHISGFYEKKYGDYDKIKGDFEKTAQEKQRLQAMYDAAIENLGDDPRVGSLEKEKAEALAQLESVRGEYTEFQKHVEAWREQEAKAYTDMLLQKYPAYFSDAAKSSKFSALLDEGWDAEVGIKVLELGDGALEFAREAKAKGAPDVIALELAEARLRAGKQKPERREAAKVMAGAEPASSPAKAQRTPADAKNHQERVAMIAARAFKKHAAGG